MKIGVTSKEIDIKALNAGAWANAYQIAIKNSTASPGRFQLQVVYAPAGGTPAVVESFNNLSISKSDPQGRFVEDVIASNSNFVIASVPATTTTAPDDTAAPEPLVSGAPGKVIVPTLKPTDPPGDFETVLQVTGGVGGVNLLTTTDLFKQELARRRSSASTSLSLSYSLLE